MKIRPEAQHVADELLRYPACLIATHVNPEGDAIGSQLALALALEQRGIIVHCYDRDGVPDTCRFMPTWERVRTVVPSPAPPLVIYVDADRLERCALSVEELPGAQSFVRIDHHQSTAVGPGLSLVDTHAAAAGELVFEVLAAMQADLTPEIATCLLAALMVDTGRFSYASTTPTTHHIAAELLAAGADREAIVDWTWGRASLSALKLKGLALSSLQVSADGQISWAVLRQQDFEAASASPEDTEGIIDQVRCVAGTRVAALFSEKHGEVRVSLRSRGRVNVAELASSFGGGGHARAAGITYNGSMDEAVAAVLQAIKDALAQIA
jgi:phosphoesterase RecJ-like protein